jgi:general secretion pathway protein F
MAVAKPVGLDELIALNEELAALIRAGVPLERGLTELAQELPGRLGTIAARLGQRLQAGESLLAVIGDDAVFPPAWRAVVAAGLRSGQLAAALESLTTTGRRIAEMRRAIGTALVYPCVVLALAYGLFVFTVTRLAPVTAHAYEGLTLSSDSLLATVARVGEAAGSWAIWPPVVALVALAVSWYRGRRLPLGPGPGGRHRAGAWWLLWPSIGQVLRDGRLATFAEVLSLLVRQQVPLDEALVLAADASGARGLPEAAREAAQRLRSGARLDGPQTLSAQLPPLVGWLIASGGQHPGFTETLASTAETYRRRAARTVAWTAVYLPVVVTAVVGGAATLVQVLTVFGPITRLLYRLAEAV